MVLTWPRTVTCDAARQQLAGVGDDPLELCGDEAEIRARDRAVDVDDRLAL